MKRLSVSWLCEIELPSSSGIEGIAGRSRSVEMGTNANKPVSVANVMTSLRVNLLVRELN